MRITTSIFFILTIVCPKLSYAEVEIDDSMHAYQETIDVNHVRTLRYVVKNNEEHTIPL